MLILRYLAFLPWLILLFADIYEEVEKYKTEANIPAIRVQYSTSRGYHISMPANFIDTVAAKGKEIVY